MRSLAFWAELANAMSAVAAHIIVVVLIWHVAHLLRLIVVRRRQSHSENILVTTIDALKALYGLLGVATTLLIDQIGVISIRDTVWLWRRVGFGGGGGPMTPGQTAVVVGGTVLLIIGTVGMTWFISKPTLGIWPAVVSVAALTLTVLYYLASV